MISDDSKNEDLKQSHTPPDDKWFTRSADELVYARVRWQRKVLKLIEMGDHERAAQLMAGSIANFYHFWKARADNSKASPGLCQEIQAIEKDAERSHMLRREIRNQSAAGEGPVAFGNKITPQVQDAIDHAQAACLRFGHPYVSTGHLIIGVLTVKRGTAAILNQSGLTVELTEHYLRAHPPISEETMQISDMIIGKSIITGFERAKKEAQGSRCGYIGTDHVLLAICDENKGHANDLFNTLNIDRTRLRQMLVERLSAKPPFDLSKFEPPITPDT